MPHLQRADGHRGPGATPERGRGGTDGPAGVLLHSGGPSITAPDAAPPAAPVSVSVSVYPAVPQPQPEVALAIDAEHVERLLSRRVGRPNRWAAPSFAREVEVIRTHLAPIRSTTSLAASFGREAFHHPEGSGGAGLGLSAIRVAYALRWIELRDGSVLARWSVLVEGGATGHP